MKKKSDDIAKVVGRVSRAGGPKGRKRRTNRAPNPNAVENDPPEAIAVREARCWELRLQFWTEPQIARELGISQPGVSKILKRVLRRHQMELGMSVQEHQIEQVHLLRAIARESWDAWIASKAGSKKVQRRTYEDQSTAPKVVASTADKPLSKALIKYGGKKFEQTVMSTEEAYGHAPYLAICIRALEDIRKITGADAPSKIKFEDARSMLAELTGTPLEQIPEGPEEDLRELPVQGSVS